MPASGRRRVRPPGTERLPARPAGGPAARTGALAALELAFALGTAARTRVASSFPRPGSPRLMTAASSGPRPLPAFGASLRLGLRPRAAPRRPGISSARFLARFPPARSPGGLVLGISRILGIEFLLMRGGHSQNSHARRVNSQHLVSPDRSSHFPSGRSSRRPAHQPVFPAAEQGPLHPAGEALGPDRKVSQWR